MTSLANPFFPKNNTIEQNLLQGLIDESIKVMGHTYYYLPRFIQKEDLVLGEDVLSKFKFALAMEMFHDQSKGWAANDNIISKFGLMIQNEMVFVISKPAWDREIVSYPDLLTMKTYSRPQEGDLIYDPVSKSLLEIKFVKDTNTDYFQFGKVYQFQLTCEFFYYDSEKIETGISDIDAFSRNSLDLPNWQIATEDGYYLASEDCGYLILDYIEVPSQADQKYGTVFTEESQQIGFNIKNPFGDE